jgi:hypothetical protein
LAQVPQPGSPSSSPRLRPISPSVSAIIGVDARFLARLHKPPLQPPLHAHSFTIRHYLSQLPSSFLGLISGPVHAPPVANISVESRIAFRAANHRQPSDSCLALLAIAPGARLFACAGNLRRAHHGVSQLFDPQAASAGARPDAFGSRPPSVRRCSLR